MGTTYKEDTLMSKIEKIGKPECRIIRETVTAALNEALAEFGLKANLGNMTYSGSNVTSKLTVSVADYNADEEEFKKGCWKYNLKPSDFGRKFESNGDTFTLCGLKPRSRKYPFLGRRGDGKKYKFPASVVTKQLNDQ
jgi:hypothetical protein